LARVIWRFPALLVPGDVLLRRNPKGYRVARRLFGVAGSNRVDPVE
jgi:hypothetical protein